MDNNNEKEILNNALKLEMDLNNYTFDDKTLVYFSRSLEEVDLYYLSLIFNYTNLTNSAHGLPHAFLKKEEVATVLPYKERKYTRAFTRLEAMSIITVTRVQKENYYKITENGRKVFRSRFEADVTFVQKSKDVRRTLTNILGIEK